MGNSGSQTWMWFQKQRCHGLKFNVFFQESESRNQAENIPMEHKANENCIQLSTFSADEAALTDSTQQCGQRASLQKTDSKGAKDQTKVTPCLALQEGAPLRFTDSRPPLPRMNVLGTNIARGKKKDQHTQTGHVPWYTS